MRKTIKSVLAIALMAVMVFSLAGCGKKEDKKEADNNKLVAVKEVTADESAMGETKEIIEVTFKDDKADTVVMKMEFADESTPSTYAGLYAASGESNGMTVTAEGNCLVMTMNATSYLEENGAAAGQELTRDALKQELENEGYTIQ